MEKRSIVTSEFDKVESFLIRQGTVRFTPFAVELNETLRLLLQKWRTEAPRDGSAHVTDDRETEDDAYLLEGDDTDVEAHDDEEEEANPVVP